MWVSFVPDVPRSTRSCNWKITTIPSFSGHKATRRDDNLSLSSALVFFNTRNMDRLARNFDDLRQIVERLTGRGVRIEIVKESLTFTGED